MGKLTDLSSRQFGRYKVLGRLPNRCKHPHWECLCECGNIRSVSTTNLTSGASESCGCLRKEVISAKYRTHGRSGTYLHNTWKNIKARCYNKNNTSYKHYGERGIKMSTEWFNSFATFASDMGERPSKDLSIDRIDFNGDYTKENCRWATATTQCRNQGVRKDNKLGLKGIVETVRGKFKVNIKVNKVSICLGTHEDLEVAKAIRLAAEEAYWKDY